MSARPERPVALVTVGNRGIGRALAEGLVARGMRFVIGVRDLEARCAVRICADCVAARARRARGAGPGGKRLQANPAKVSVAADGTASGGRIWGKMKVGRAV